MKINHSDDGRLTVIELYEGMEWLIHSYPDSIGEDFRHVDISYRRGVGGNSRVNQHVAINEHGGVRWSDRRELSGVPPSVKREAVKHLAKFRPKGNADVRD